MKSDFLEKFKGKTSKVSREGLIDRTQAIKKKQSNPILSKPKDVYHQSSEKQAKPQNKKQKNGPSAKYNKCYPFVSHTASDSKRAKQKSFKKNGEVPTNKQNKRPLDSKINVKKQPLKLPKIQKENLLGNRSESEQPIRYHLKQNRQKVSIPEKPPEKLKKTMITEAKENKPQKYREISHGLESTLDKQVLLHLKKLNNLEVIVKEISIKRRSEMERQKLQNSRHCHKRVTIHH